MAREFSKLEYDALVKELEKTKANLSTSESHLQLLKEDNNRLEAALAVEQGARDSDILKRAEHELHLVNYKYSRIMKLFDRLKLERPKTHTDLRMFMNDDDIEDAMSRLKEMVTTTSGERANDHQSTHHDLSNGDALGAEKHDAPSSSGVESAPAESNGNNHKQLSGEEQAGPMAIAESQNDVHMTDAQGEVENIPSNENDKPADEADEEVPDGQKQAEDVLKIAEPKPADVDELVTGPGAMRIGDSENVYFLLDVLKVLTGASSVTLDESEKKVRIEMLNDTKKRSLNFCLSWTGELLRLSKEFASFDNEELPGFLRESAIEFERAQAPNFLLTIMGAMFDFEVTSTNEEPEPLKQTEDPPQAPMAEDANYRQAALDRDISEKLAAPLTQLHTYGDNLNPQEAIGAEKDKIEAVIPSQQPSSIHAAENELEKVTGHESSVIGAQPGSMQIEEAHHTSA